MKPWILLPLAAAAAIPTRLAVSASPPAPGETSPAATGAATPALRELAANLDALAARESLVADGIRSLGPLPASAPSALGAEPPDADEIAAAVTRWLAQNDLEAEALTVPFVPEAVDDSSVADLSMEQILAFFEGREAFEEQGELMFQSLRDAGRMEEYVAAMEARVAADPENSELQTDLGHAYLQQLFGMGATAETGRVALLADDAFDTALELDPRNVEARFTKSIALSNWPPFMGKTGEAIENFEILIAQIEEPGSEHSMPEAYLFLGGVYQRSGEKDKALTTWRSGLERHPDFEALRAQVELIDAAADAE